MFVIILHDFSFCVYFEKGFEFKVKSGPCFCFWQLKVKFGIVVLKLDVIKSKVINVLLPGFKAIKNSVDEHYIYSSDKWSFTVLGYKFGAQDFTKLSDDELKEFKKNGGFYEKLS